jgi:hypothetical protein
MNKELFKERYLKFNEKLEDIEKALQTIINFEQYSNKEIEETTIDDIYAYSNHLIEQNQNTYENYIHIARYYYYIDKKEEYIHMTKYFNAHGVFENIIERIGTYESKEKQQEIIKNTVLPPFGTDALDMPKYTKDFVDKLNKYLPKESCIKILAGNNHRINPKGFDKEKEFYQESKSLKDYLKERHNRKVEELEQHYKNNQVWFEQVITQDAIDYVKSNQEILSGVLENDKLYITKIPYDIKNFLEETDDTMKKYYACHCTFVRENIKNKTEDIDKDWCYCSAGFAKFPFETIFDQELNIKLLKTPLDGDYICRFEIDLSNVEYKK